VRHDEIRIAYEWQFLDGSAQGSSVYYADPGAAPEAGSSETPPPPAPASPDSSGAH
jgi:hypothetical protein